MQNRVDEVESSKRRDAEKARDQLQAKCQELKQARLEIESIASGLEQARQQYEHDIDEVKQQRDQVVKSFDKCCNIKSFLSFRIFYEILTKSLD